MAVGKITGQMLGDTLGNLDRDGVDLAFDTDLIYLDVINRRVGIKNTSPTRELDVIGTTRTTNLEVTSTLDVGNIRIQGNNIFSTSGVLNLAPSSGSQVVYQNKLIIDDLQLEGNHIRTINSNASLDITANGTGTINLNSNVEVIGNLHATGTITADGNLQLGNSDTDNIVFNGEIASDIVPDLDDTYKLGSPSKRWSDIWVNNITATTISTGGAVVDGVDLTLRQGNIYFVAVNGDDGNTGTHIQDPLSSVGRALDLATSGDTVYIFPGTYSETLPLEVPVGVTVKGAGIRSVTIQPDSDDTVDMFLLNGETTIEDLTITGFKFDSSTNTGYAFKFAPNMTVTSRSPYIRNVTVITQGSVTSLSDPRGFLTGDAGKGAFIDGSVANASSKEASMLFHSATFICPGVDIITATNGVRVEWLNSFTYFADRGFYAYSGSTGFAGNGKTRIKITNLLGTFAIGNTLSYYDTDGTTVLASGTIESIDGDFFVIDGKSLGFESLIDREAKTVFVNGNAQASTAQFKYGTASLLLDGTGDYISLTGQPDFIFTGAWAAEGWIRPTSVTGSHYIFAIGNEASGRYNIFLDGTQLKGNYYGQATATFGGTFAINTWYHLAVVRSGTTVTAYVNGTALGVTDTVSGTVGNNGDLKIGSDASGGAGFAGYIDDVRITKDLARYTSGFTAPAAALTGDNSSVLLLHFDSPNGSTILLDDGVTLQDIRTNVGGTATIIDYADYSDWGAEIRSIASASVYGNYGVYGDGIGVIGYFIGHNFGYVGAGKESDNDPSYYPDDSTNVNEVVEINDAKIYYTSVDHKGDFKVGDYFVVDQENGTVTFNATGVSISSSSGLTFTDGIDTTIISPSYVQTGNIKISGNTIESITGGITLTAANTNITSTANITTTGSIVVDSTLAVGGNTTLGDSTADTVTYTARIASDLVPSSNAVYNLGSASNQWVNVYLANAQIDDISIAGNLIQTTVSNSDLELRANGTGSVVIDDLSFNNNTLVSNTVNTDIIINPNGTGTIQLQKDTDITGNLSVTGNITLGGNIQIGDQASDTINLVGRVTNNIVPAVTATYNIGSTALRWANLFTDKLVIDDIVIDTNVIENTVSNADLELRASGTGSVKIDDISFNSNEISTNTLNTNLILNPNGTGSIELQKNTNITGNLTVTGTGTFTGNTVFGNESSDTVTFNSLIQSNFIPFYNSTYDLGSAVYKWDNFYVSKAVIDDIVIDTNVIENTASNADLELRANGTGSVRIDLLDFNNNTITSNTTNTDIQINPNGTGTIQLLKDTVVTGNLTVTGTTSVTGNITLGDSFSDTVTFVAAVASDILPSSNSVYSLGAASYRWANGYFNKVIVDDIEIDTNVIQSTLSNQNLELRANGTGSIQIDLLNFKSNAITSNTTNTDIQINPNGTGTIQLQKDTVVTGDLTVTGNYILNGNVQLGDASTDTINPIGRFINSIVPYTTNTYSLGTSSLRWLVGYFDKVVVDDIEIDTNVIQSTLSNQNLELRANGTGSIQIDLLNFKSNAITSNTTNTDIQINPNGTGVIQLLKDTNITGNLAVSGNIVLGGNITIGDQSSDTINLVGSITNNLIPSVNSTFDIGTSSLRWRNLYASKLVTDDIEIDTNVIQSTLSNQNLELRTNGTGSVQVDLLNFKSNTITSNTTNTDIQITPNGTGIIQLLKNTNVTGTLTVSGTTSLNGNTVIGDSSTDTVSVPARFTTNLVPNTNAINDIGSNSLRWNNIYISKLVTDDIEIDTNVIQSTLSNQNLELRANGTGSVQIDTLNFKSNTISSNTTNADINITPNGTGIIQLQKDTVVSGTLTVNGTYILTGNVQFGDSSSDTINPIGRFINNLVPQTTNTYSIGNSSLRWANGYFNKIVIDDIEIDTNVIQSTLSNQNLDLRANGTGSVQIDTLNFKSNIISSNTTNTDIQINPNGTGIISLTKDTIISGNLSVTGDTNVYGYTTIGSNNSDTITLIGHIASNVIPIGSGYVDIGSNSLRWRNLYAGKMVIDDIEIDTNVIQSTLSNQNLELRANGTGSIQIDLLNFKSNTISSNTTNTDININPNGTGIIQLQKDTVVTGSLTVNGTYILTGNIQLGDNVSDTINPVGSFINNLVPLTTNTYSIGGPNYRWAVGYFNKVVIDDIEIDTNVIQSTLSNQNLELRANGTGSIQIDTLNFKSNTISSNTTNADINIAPNGTGTIQLQKDTDITGNLSVSGNITLGGNIQIGDQTSDTINFVGSITNNLVPSVSGSFTLGSSNFKWANIFLSNAQIDDIEINDNYIRTTNSNADLELSANGTGVVRVPSSNVTISQNLTVSGTTNLANTTVTGTLTVDNLVLNASITAGSFYTGDIEIAGNVIRTLNSNSNLELRANGTGAVFLENLSVQQSTISTVTSGQDIELTPSGSGIVKINSTQALQVPVGTDAQRPTAANGMIRFNSTINQYEGYNGSYWVQLGGITDVDRNTYITPELTPGANDNTIRFYNNGALTASLTSTEFNVNKLVVDEVQIDGNVISTISTNADLELKPNGTGAVVIDGFRWTTNTLTNTNSGAVTTFQSTGTGYYYISGTNAVVIPAGANGDRPGSPVTGMMRFNTDLTLVEIFDGVSWTSVAGAGGGITLAQAEDIALAQALIFG